MKGIKRALKRLKADVDQCTYVGDAPGDITAAKAAGISIADAAWAKTTDDKELLPLHLDWIFCTFEKFKN